MKIVSADHPTWKSLFKCWGGLVLQPRKRLRRITVNQIDNLPGTLAHYVNYHEMMR